MTCKYLACKGPIHAFAWVLGALALGACLFGGCSKNEPREEVSASGEVTPTPDEYMRDPVFREKLKVQIDERNELLSQRVKIVRRLEAMSKAMVAKMPNATDEEVVAALEKDPEWNSLKKRVEDLVTAFDEKRAETLETVRTRISPKPALSK